MQQLVDMRQRIDQLDRELLRVVAQRMSLVREIGATKPLDQPIADLDRERALSAHWEQAAQQQGVAPALARRLLGEILTYSKRLQELDRQSGTSPLRIGYQGEPGAYSDLAIQGLLRDRPIETVGCRTFAELLEALQRGELDAAMLPVENTIIGSITEPVALLKEQPVSVIAETVWRVQHCLAAVPETTLGAIRRVLSHPVALQQCKARIDALGCEPQPFEDTAAAAAVVAASRDLSAAAICSAEAAEKHGLTILIRDMEDEPDNFTRFLLVARTGEPRLSPHSPDAPLAARTLEHRTVVKVGGVAIGAERFTLIAGPCAVESREQIRSAARMVREAGGEILRGGAFKPRTSPYSFQGLGLEGLELLQEAGREHGLPTVSEVLDVRHLEKVAERVDMIQVGARNMQNFELLKELGRIDKPILLKRGMSATLDEFLQAAEYILLGGNRKVVLCERGIRTFERSTRNTLDIAAVPLLKQRTHLPVLVDPSHAAGRWDLVIPLALAAAAAGADGVIVEAHPRPDEALSDREQALGPDQLAALHDQLRSVLQAQGRPC